MPSSYQALVLVLVWLGLGWPRFGLVLFGMCLKLNYQVSLLTLGGWGWGKSKLKPNPAWAELGKKMTGLVWGIQRRLF